MELGMKDADYELLGSDVPQKKDLTLQNEERVQGGDPQKCLDSKDMSCVALVKKLELCEDGVEEAKTSKNVSIETLQTFIPLDEFCALTRMESDCIPKECLQFLDEGAFLDPRSALKIFLDHLGSYLIASDVSGFKIQPLYLEETIGILSGLYERVLEKESSLYKNSKQEADKVFEDFLALKKEHESARSYTQKLEILLQKKEEEIDFLKRKYKLMWGKVSHSFLKPKGNGEED